MKITFQNNTDLSKTVKFNLLQAGSLQNEGLKITYEGFGFWGLFGFRGASMALRDKSITYMIERFFEGEELHKKQTIMFVPKASFEMTLQAGERRELEFLRIRRNELYWLKIIPKSDGFYRMVIFDPDYDANFRKLALDGVDYDKFLRDFREGDFGMVLKHLITDDSNITEQTWRINHKPVEMRSLLLPAEVQGLYDFRLSQQTSMKRLERIEFEMTCRKGGEFMIGFLVYN